MSIYKGVVLINIWILETGGTIASKKLDQTIDLSLKESDYSAFGDVIVQRPYYILSENLTPERWTLLAKEVRAALDGGAEGILITHGSDTLPYTAAALSFLLSDLEIPIVITASNRPPEEEGSNAAENLAASFALLSLAPGGVWVVWQNPDGVTYAHRGDALAEAVGDWFFSHGEPLGVRKEGTWELKEETFSPKDPVFAPENFLYNIYVLRALPGQNYERIVFPENMAAVLHTLYHSGTVCAVGEETSFSTLSERCRRENLPLYICPAKEEGEATYATASVLGEDAMRLPYLSTEAAYTLLMLIYNQTEEKAENLIKQKLLDRKKTKR